MAGKVESKRIPRFRSLEEEAEFWDTHDSTEFEDQFRPTRLRFAADLQHVLGIALDPKLIDRLADSARGHGIGLDKLAAQLIEEGLDRLDAADAAPTAAKKGKHHG